MNNRTTNSIEKGLLSLRMNECWKNLPVCIVSKIISFTGQRYLFYFFDTKNFFTKQEKYQLLSSIRNENVLHEEIKKINPFQLVHHQKHDFVSKHIRNQFYILNLLDEFNLFSITLDSIETAIYHEKIGVINYLFERSKCIDYHKTFSMDSACRSSKNNIIFILHTYFNIAFDQFHIDISCTRGNVWAVEYIHKHTGFIYSMEHLEYTCQFSWNLDIIIHSLSLGIELSKKCFRRLAYHGHIDTFLYFDSIGLQYIIPNDKIPSFCLIKEACKGGYISVIKHFYNVCQSKNLDFFTNSYDLLEMNLMKGNLEASVFLIEEVGIVLSNYIRTNHKHKCVISKVAARGHTRIIKYLINNENKHTFCSEQIKWIIIAALKYDKIDIINYLKSIGLDVTDDIFHYINSIKMFENVNGIFTLSLLNDHIIDKNLRVYKKLSNLNYLKYLFYSVGIKGSRQTMNYALKTNCMNIIKFVHLEMRIKMTEAQCNVYYTPKVREYIQMALSLYHKGITA